MRIKDTINGITIDLDREFINRGEILEYAKTNTKISKNNNTNKNNKRM